MIPTDEEFEEESPSFRDTDEAVDTTNTNEGFEEVSLSFRDSDEAVDDTDTDVEFEEESTAFQNVGNDEGFEETNRSNRFEEMN